MLLYVLAGNQTPSTGSPQSLNQRKRIRKRSKDKPPVDRQVKVPKKQENAVVSQQYHQQQHAPAPELNINMRSNSGDPWFSVPQTPQSSTPLSPDVDQIMSEICTPETNQQQQQGNPEDDLMSVQLQSFHSGQNLSTSSDTMIDQFFGVDQFDFDIQTSNSLKQQNSLREVSNPTTLADPNHVFRSPQQPAAAHFISDNSGEDNLKLI